MYNTLFYSLLIMILLTTFRGYRRGLYGFLYGVATWALVIALLPSMAERVSDKLEKNEKFKASVEEKVEPYVDEISVGIMSDELSGLITDTNLIQNYFQDFMGTEEQLDEYEKMLMGEPYDEEKLKGQSILNSDLLSGDIELPPDMRQEAKDKIVDYISYIIAICAAYILIKVLAVIAGLFIKAFMGKHTRSTIDLAGLLWGIAEGILYVFVFLLIVSAIEPSGIGKVLAKSVTENDILKKLYENNVLGILLDKMPTV